MLANVLILQKPLGNRKFSEHLFVVIGVTLGVGNLGI